MFLMPDGVFVMVGMVVESVPLVAAVYHCSELPDKAVAAQTDGVPFSQKSAGSVPVGATGSGITLVVKAILGPSQPPVAVLVFWLTHAVLTPDGVLVITGAVADAVPNVATVYHCKVLFVAAAAVQTGTVVFSQKSGGLVPVGANGMAVTTTLTLSSL
jgi:hypothetical protein